MRSALSMDERRPSKCRGRGLESRVGHALMSQTCHQPPVTTIDDMPQSTYAIMAVALASALSIPGVTSATAAGSYEGRITQESCDSRGGTYSFYRGIRSCTTTFDKTRRGTPRGGTTTPQDGTYYRGMYYKVYQNISTTTWSQRGNQVPQVSSEHINDVLYVGSSCFRVDSHLTPNEVTTAVDLSECEQRNVYSESM